MQKKTIAQEIREMADRLAQINPEVQEAVYEGSTYTCEDCGDEMHKPTTDCSHRL